MPPPNYMQPSYLGAMDMSSYYLGLDAFAPVYTPTVNTGMAFEDSGLTTSDMGLTTHPFQNQLQSMQAKIRSGASKIEFEFAGKGKGNQQSGTPEMYGQEEREIMRQLAQINNVRTSTHATFSVSGLAGLGQRGFSKQAQHETVQEVQRAIDFAKDATTGGAIVVHTGEWQRPVNHYYGEKDGMEFELYPGEHDEEQLYVVDSKTGEFIQGIAKNRSVEVPKYQTARDIMGLSHSIEGVDVDGNPATITPDDYVTVDGKRIDPTKTSHLFRRVPEYDKDEVRFKTEMWDWDRIVKETKQWNERHPNDQIMEEEYFARLQLDNQILQFRGNSLYHGQRYELYREQYEKLNKALKFYQDLGKDMSEEQKRELLMTKKNIYLPQDIVPPEEISIEQWIREQLEDTEHQMRHVHESSASSDARANDLERTRSRLKTVKDYGLEQTGRALGRLAMEAMEKSEEAKKMRSKNEKWEDLYIAPENWHPAQYGSHPDELLEIVRAGREKFKDELRSKRHIQNEQELDQLARKHIKTTFDIGHLNMWRSMLKRKQGENEQQFQQRFNNWIFTHLDKLAKEDAIGHLHLTDNFGYNDEHVTPGQGNAPVKEFVKWAKERGYKDFIVEAGSFNGETVMHDAWSYFGVVPWKSNARQFAPRTMGSFHNAHAGWYAPPNYIVGSYVPSNEWTLWSGVPLE